MLIDINTYIGHWPFRQLRNNTAQGLLSLMDKYGVDMAAVSSLNAVFYKDTQEGNLELIEEIKDNKDRFIPFAVINPKYVAWEKDFRYCVEKLGMKGLELYPYYHNYDLTEPEPVELIRLAGEMNIPVHLPCAIVNVRQRHWMDTNDNLDLGQVEKLLSLCPDTDFIISNGPSHINAQQLKKASEGRKGRVYYDFARVEVFTLRSSATDFETLVKYAGIDHIVFGSVMPFQYGDPQFVRLAYSGLSEEDMEKVTSGNLKRLFRL
jgi:predicted TIM-barrel fold metal-dependent hydrolase